MLQVRRAVMAVTLLTASLLGFRPALAETAEVRTRWRVLAIGCDVEGDPKGETKELLYPGRPLTLYAMDRMVRAVERALPGLDLEWTADLGYTAGPRLEGAGAFARDASLMDAAMASLVARAGDDPVASQSLERFDLVLVFSDRVEAAMGWMGHTWRLPDGRELAVGCVCTKPSSKLAHVWLNFIPRGPLRPLLLLLKPRLKEALDTDFARERAAAAIAAHEFGHHLPGSAASERHDGSRGAGLKDGDERHNPDGHGPECVMYKTLSPAAIWAKIRAGGPDMVAFCGRCRERLGVTAPKTWWR